MVFQKTIPKSITTVLTSRPSSAQIVIENPLDDDLFVNGIEILPDAEFSKKGKIIILINEVSVFDAKDSETLFGYAKFPVPLGKVLRRSNDIQIFAWNGTDSNSITVKFNLSLSKVLQPFNSQAVPLGKDVFNQIVSEPEVIFSETKRSPATYTKLIDLKGYDKFIVTMTAPNPNLPPNEPTFSDWGTDPPEPERIIDGDLSNFTNGLHNVGNTPVTKLDFGSIATRHLKMKINYISGQTATYDLETSDDDIVYNSKDNGTLPAFDSNRTLDGTEHSFRYARFTFHQSASEPSQTKIFEMYDALELGGTGALSFEIQDKETAEWIEYIASSEFGTISFGTTSIIKQIGGINNIATSGKPFVLPSTQTLFRAKYTVTVSSITNAISILRTR